MDKIPASFWIALSGLLVAASAYLQNHMALEQQMKVNKTYFGTNYEAIVEQVNAPAKTKGTQ